MFLRVGSGKNESTMSRFSTRIKSLHILGNFSELMVVEFEDASTSFCGRKAHLFGSCLFTHDWASTSNKKSWMDSTTVSDTGKTRRSRHAWPLPRHAQSLNQTVEKQKLKLELLRGSKPKLESLPVSVEVHEHLVRAGCMFFGTTTRRTLTRLHRNFTGGFRS